MNRIDLMATTDSTILVGQADAGHTKGMMGIVRIHRIAEIVMGILYDDGLYLL